MGERMKGNLPPSALKAEAVRKFFATPDDGLRERVCPCPDANAPSGKCGKSLGWHEGRGKIVCPKCGTMVEWE